MACDFKAMYTKCISSSLPPHIELPLIDELAGSRRDLFFVKYQSGQRQINLISKLARGIYIHIYMVELSKLGNSWGCLSGLR